MGTLTLPHVLECGSQRLALGQGLSDLGGLAVQHALDHLTKSGSDAGIRVSLVKQGEQLEAQAVTTGPRDVA